VRVKRHMARPSKLTPELQAKIVNAIKAGNYMETAAAYAGISKDTLYVWLRDGARAKSGKKRAFSDSIKGALAESEIDDVARIRAAGEKSWQCIAWHLERRFNSRWGRRADPAPIDEPEPVDAAAILASDDWKEIAGVVKKVLGEYDGATEKFREALAESMAGEGNELSNMTNEQLETRLKILRNYKRARGEEAKHGGN